MDHHRRQPRAFAPIAGVNPLDHLFAAFMFEIDVDIGRLAAFLGDEPLKDQGDAFGRHFGDAQKIAHHRIGRRPAPLAQDAFGAGELHDVMHRQEIGRIGHFADQRQFLFNAVNDLGRRPCGIAPMQPFARQTFQPVLGGFAVGGLVGVLVLQVRQPKRTAVGNFDRAAQGGRMAVEQPRHLGPRFQATLAIGQPVFADIVDGAAHAQAGQHIGQGAAGGAVHQHIAHRDHGQVDALGHDRQSIKPRLIAAIIARGGAQKALAGQGAGEDQQVALDGLWVGVVQRVGRQRNQHYACAPCRQIGPL